MGERQARQRAPKRLILAAIVLTAALLAPAVYHLVFHLPHRVRANALEDEVEQSVEGFRARFAGPDRYERPVLRGESIEGNAGAALVEAARPFAAIEIPLPVWRRLMDGETPPAATRRLAHEHAGELAQLRAATQRSWSFVDPEDGTSPSTCDNGVGVACTLLAVLADDADPDECLRMITDYIRIGQDNRAGGCVGFCDPRMVASRATECASEAERGSVAQAARELVSIVEHEPSDLVWHEAEAIHMTRERLAQLDDVPWFPTDAEGWIRIRSQATTLDDADQWLNGPRPRPGRDPSVPQCPAGFGMQICEHVSVPRSLAVMMVVLAATDRVEGFASERPAVLDEPWATDPRSGDPLRWEVSSEGREARVFAGQDDLVATLP